MARFSFDRSRFHRLAAAALLLGGVLASAPACAQGAGEPPGAAAFRARNFAGAYLQLLPAAHAGNAQAQFMLGQMSDSGLGVAVDQSEAARWYRMAAQGGSAPAAYALAVAYAEGRGVAVDRQNAVAWLTTAAYGNFVPAILAVADLYDRGAGVPQNPEQATQWLRRAAALGSPRATYVLGERVLAGRGGPADAADGWRLIRGAAQLGDAAAMIRLAGAVAAEGHRATREQRIEGLTMILTALRVGSPEVKREATRLRGEIQPHVFPDKIAEATSRSRAWQPPPGVAEVDGPPAQAEAPRQPGAAPGNARGNAAARGGNQRAAAAGGQQRRQ